MDKRTKYWCAFSRLTKTGSMFVNRVFNHFNDIELAWNSETYDLWKIEGIRRSSLEAFLEERRTINPDECMDYLQEKEIDYISFEDERYPYLLKQIDNPPCGLFCVGDITACNLDRTIAVVGSRRASENSRNTLYKILSSLHDTDICIVSGLADGIDTVAHKSAVENNMKTIAVIGGGFDYIYPKSNIKLFNEIKDGKGAILTEYWPNVEAIGWHFPARNRIVSGLAKGTLVAEAAIKSGAMITAKLALEQGRELMCMPGLISNPNTEGIYKLIKNGATIVTNHQDILDAMNWEIKQNKQTTKDELNNLSDEERLIVDLLRKDMLTLDELILKTNLNINDLMVILTKLEIDGTISQTNGDKYTSQL